MAQNPLIKRYLDAGMAFTQMTQARAEAIVKDLVKAGEVQAARTEDLANQILERSRKNTERLLEQVRKEVRDQVASLGLATKDDINRLERKIDAAPAKGAAKRGSAKKGRAKAGATKKRARKKAGARKSGAKKAARSKKAAKRAARS